MIIKLLFKQKQSSYGYMETSLFQVQELDENGKWVKHLKQTPELIEKINNITIEINDNETTF